MGDEKRVEKFKGEKLDTMINGKGGDGMFHVICNTSSGRGRRKNFRKRVEKAFAAADSEAVFYQLETAEETLSLVRRLSSSGEVNLVAMGGDGTVNTVLNGIADFSKATLGILPGGSGNDFARRIGIPENPEKAVDILLHCMPKVTDFYECSGIRGLNAVGAGIDIDILETYSRMKVFHGKIKYLASLLKVLLHFDFYEFSLLREKAAVERHSALIICAANGSTFGGGIKICPEAVPDDGLLDLVVVENLPKKKVPGALIKLLQGKILKQPYTLYERVKTGSAVFDPPASVQIDGEIDRNLPFNVKVISGLLKVYRP